MNTGLEGHEQKPQTTIKDAIRRMLGFKALRTLRGMVDEIEREEAFDKKALRALFILLPVILILVAGLYIWFRSTMSIQQF